MPRARKVPGDEIKKRPPAKTPKARENQLINAAVDLAEKQLREGTASAMVITHFLKLGSSKEILEAQKLAMETQLLKVKAEALESVKRTEDLYVNALKAMQSYSSRERDESEIEDS